MPERHALSQASPWRLIAAEFNRLFASTDMLHNNRVWSCGGIASRLRLVVNIAASRSLTTLSHDINTGTMCFCISAPGLSHFPEAYVRLKES